MKHSEGSTLEALRRIDSFLDANSTTFASLNGSTTRRELRDSITQLSAFAVEQEDGGRASRGETSKLRALRDALRKYHMQGIAAVAKNRLRSVPDFSSMTMPPFNATTERLLAAASAMSEAARRHEAVLVDGGLAEDFVAQLDSATDALKQSIDGRSAHVVRRSGATAGLSAQRRRARNVIRALDARLLPLIGPDESLLAAWNAAKRIPRKSGKAVVAPPTTPAPAPAAAPASSSPPATGAQAA